MRSGAALKPLDVRRRHRLDRLARIGKREPDVVQGLVQALDDQSEPAANFPTKVISLE